MRNTMSNSRKNEETKMSLGLYLGIGVICCVVSIIVLNLCGKWYPEECFVFCIMLIPFWLPMIIIAIVIFIILGTWCLLTKGEDI